MSTSQTLLLQAQKDLKAKAFAGAQSKAHSVIKAEPLNSAAWHILGLVSIEEHNFEEAIGYFQKAVSTAPKAIYYFNLGIALRRVDRFLESIEAYEACVKLDPKMVRAWGNLGNAYRIDNQTSKALYSYQKCLELEPESSITHYNMGILYHLSDQYDDAIKSYRRAIKYNPNNAKAHCNLGTAYSKLRRFEKSLRYYEKALEIDANLFDAYNNYGGTLLELERYKEAEKKLRQALKIRPASAVTLRNITLCKTYDSLEDNDALYIQKLLKKPNLSDADKIHLYFGLGKIAKDAKNNDKAFQYYKSGNDLNFKLFPFNIFSLQDYTRNIIKTFNETFILNHQNKAKSKVQPLLIIGPPRSGKSLLEKILVTHSEVGGAGEVGLSGFASKSGPRSDQDPKPQVFPDWVSQISQDDIKSFVDGYENKIQRDTPFRRYLIDTMPGNAYYIGLFAMLFPQVKIIMMEREPLDLNLRMYFKYFVNKHYYAYNLKTLGQYHRIFESMMNHWSEVLPDQTHRISYESLVKNPKEVLAGVCEFLDIDNSGCQIEDTLHHKEIGFHKEFESYLEPLKEGLSFNPGTDEVRIAQILKEATDIHKLQKYEEAAKLYRYVLQLEPDNPIPIHLLGVIAFETGRGEKAIELIEHALKLNPHYIQAHQNLANILKQRGQEREALEHEQKAYTLSLNLHSKLNKKLSEEDRQVLHDALLKRMSVIKEVDKKILFQGKSQSSSETIISEKTPENHFKNLSYGSYRASGTKEHQVSRLNSWHFLYKHQALVEQIFNHPKDEVRILDIGCASGYFRRIIEGNVSPTDTKKLFYWGVDASVHLLERATYQETHIESGAAGQYMPSAYLIHDVKSGLPFKDNFFDMVVNFEMIEYLPFPLAVQLVHEMYRVLSAQGMLYLSTTISNRDRQDLSHNQLTDLFSKKGFEIRHEYSGQSDLKSVMKAVPEKFKPLVDQLAAYHPPGMVSAMLAPLYSEVANQKVYYLYKPAD